MSVTRCVCAARTFASLGEQAAAAGWTTVAELAAHTEAGNGCRSCRPYLAAMLRTGCTRFAVREGTADPEPCARQGWDSE